MKYLIAAGIVVAVVVVYVIMGALQPTVNALIQTANASGNWTNFESTQAAINGFPIYMWAIPGLVGVVAIVITLKSGGGS